MIERVKIGLARRLRYFADRIDRANAPKGTHWTFTFERGKGAKFREDGRGCPIWYLSDEDYERAHDESDTAESDARWKAELIGLRATERIRMGMQVSSPRINITDLSGS